MNTTFAQIKSTNKASLKIFDFVGFKEYSFDDDVVYLRRFREKITFKKVDEGDEEILFELLKERKYSISHKDLPTKSDHIKFVKNHSYRHWAIIFENDIPIGNYYLQNNNSIG